MSQGARSPGSAPGTSPSTPPTQGPGDRRLLSGTVGRVRSLPGADGNAGAAAGGSQGPADAWQPAPPTSATRARVWRRCAPGRRTRFDAVRWRCTGSACSRARPTASGAGELALDHARHLAGPGDGTCAASRPELPDGISRAGRPADRARGDALEGRPFRRDHQGKQRRPYQVEDPTFGENILVSQRHPGSRREAAISWCRRALFPTAGGRRPRSRGRAHLGPWYTRVSAAAAPINATRLPRICRMTDCDDPGGGMTTANAQTMAVSLDAARRAAPLSNAQGSAGEFRAFLLASRRAAARDFHLYQFRSQVDLELD